MVSTNPRDPAIFDVVQDAFAEALGLDLDEVSYESKIIDDLGAESLDLLDIVFRLERSFDIKIPRGGIETAAKDGLTGDEVYEVNGVLTSLGLEKLSQAMPEVPREEFTEGLKVAEVPLLFRVATFCRLICHLMEEKAQLSA
jgi:acyl carrier protein